MYNLEATPAEGTTYRFAREDRKRFSDILQAGTDEEPYYTNPSQFPARFTDDPFEALERQEELQRAARSGRKELRCPDLPDSRNRLEASALGSKAASQYSPRLRG